MILARNCPHENDIYTLIVNAESMVIKSSYSAEGITRLTREHAGYQWYFRQLESFGSAPLHFIKKNNSLYARLYINLFPGRSGECYKSLSHNRGDLLKAIDAYAKIWPKRNGSLVPLHGDFSLGNMIIDGEDLRIIDWEHFQPDVAPWGFDLVNLLYESAFFSFRGKNKLNQSDIEVFIEIRKEICKKLDSVDDFKCTIENLTGFISKNVFIWGRLANKLPVTKLSKDQKYFLMMIE